MLDEFKKLYLDKNFKGALEFLKNNKADIPDAVFHYNYGTVLYKLENYAGARFHFEKAKKLGDSNYELINNLNTVKQTISIDKIEEVNVQNFLVNTPVDYYILSSLLLVAISMFVFKVFKNKIVLAFLLLLALAPIGVNKFYVESLKSAVVLNQTSIHEGPSEVFSSSSLLPAGVKVLYTKKYEQWLFVVYPSSLTGWVNSKDLGIL